MGSISAIASAILQSSLMYSEQGETSTSESITTGQTNYFVKNRTGALLKNAIFITFFECSQITSDEFFNNKLYRGTVIWICNYNNLQS